MDFNIVQSYILKLPEIEDLKRQERVRELIVKYSENTINEYLRKIVDRRHKIIVSAREEMELIGMDFSFDYYINTLKKELSFEKGKPLKKVINCTGIIYSNYIGERFYSKELLSNFDKVFDGYNNLELDEEKGEKLNIDGELSKLLKQISKDKEIIILNNVMCGIYLIVDTLFKDKEVLMSLSDTFYLSQGMGIQDIVKSAGGKERLVGYINRVLEKDYYDHLKNRDELVVYTDMFENSSKNIKKLELSSLEKFCDRATTLYIGDRVYIQSDSNEIKSIGVELGELTNKKIDILLIDLSKLVGGPESALLIADKKLIDKIRANFMSNIFSPNKETKVLTYFTMKLYLEKRYNEIYINSVFNLTLEKLREKNKRFMRNLEREIGDRIEMNQFAQKFLKINENVSEDYSFEREVVWIKPLYKDAKELEREMRLNEPNILCWLYDDRLIFNLQLVKDDEEDMIIDFLGKRV